MAGENMFWWAEWIWVREPEACFDDCLLLWLLLRKASWERVLCWVVVREGPFWFNFDWLVGY